MISMFLCGNPECTQTVMDESVARDNGLTYVCPSCDWELDVLPPRPSKFVCVAVYQAVYESRVDPNTGLRRLHYRLSGRHLPLLRYFDDENEGKIYHAEIKTLLDCEPKNWHYPSNRLGQPIDGKYFAIIFDEKHPVDDYLVPLEGMI